jgi:hypothetical protein
MMASRPSRVLVDPVPEDLTALVQQDVSAMALIRPSLIQIALGHKAPDGRFEPDASGSRWYAFDVADAADIVFWQRDTGEIATSDGRAFALGQERIGEAATYSFDCALNIFDDPLDWLRANRDGIVVLPNRWQDAFDRLRDAPRIAIAETLLPLYRRHMKPARMPQLLVIPSRRRAA